MKILTAAITFLIVLFASQAAYAGCVRTEQAGCLEIDLLNFQYDTKNQLHGQMVATSNQDGAIDPQIGPRLYRQYTGGSAQGAGSKTFYVYMWNASCNASEMSEYHIVGRNGANPRRNDVTTASTNAGPAGFTGYSIGNPHLAFVVETDAPVAAIQFPWSCINSNTYILVCSGDQATIYPDRVTADKGIWLLPSQLANFRQRSWEYVILPFLSI